jgi:hypothetical protein
MIRNSRHPPIIDRAQSTRRTRFTPRRVAISAAARHSYSGKRVRLGAYCETLQTSFAVPLNRHIRCCKFLAPLLPVSTPSLTLQVSISLVTHGHRKLTVILAWLLSNRSGFCKNHGSSTLGRYTRQYGIHRWPNPSQEFAMGSDAHPFFVGSDVEASDFSSQSLEECFFRRTFSHCPGFACTAFSGSQPDTNVRGLKAGLVGKEITKCHCIDHLTRHVRIPVDFLNTIAKCGKALFNGFASEAGSLSSRHKIALFSGPPFVRFASRFYIAL